MSRTEIPVTMTCKKCGGTVFEHADNPTDSSPVKCKKCGTVVGNLGQIRRGAKKVVKDKVANELKKTLRKAFKGSKNIRFK